MPTSVRLREVIDATVWIDEDVSWASMRLAALPSGNVAPVFGVPRTSEPQS